MKSELSQVLSHFRENWKTGDGHRCASLFSSFRFFSSSSIYLQPQRGLSPLSFVTPVTFIL